MFVVVPETESERIDTGDGLPIIRTNNGIISQLVERNRNADCMIFLLDGPLSLDYLRTSIMRHISTVDRPGRLNMNNPMVVTDDGDGARQLRNPAANRNLE